MTQKAFDITRATKSGPHGWIVEGRAYVDIALGDRLTDVPEGTSSALVVGLQSYRRDLPVLYTMMTGVVILQGEFQSEPTSLFVLD